MRDCAKTMFVFIDNHIVMLFRFLSDSVYRKKGKQNATKKENEMP